MITSRSKGIATLGVACQCVVVAVGFWLWLILTHGQKIWGLNLGKYLLYNAVLMIGITLAFATAKGRTWFSQHDFLNCHRRALRQTAFAAGFLLLLLVGNRDEIISRIFLFTFLPFLLFILIATHRLFPPMLQKMSFGGERLQRVLLAGNGLNVVGLHKWLNRKEALGCKVMGMVCGDGSPGVFCGFKVLGAIEDLDHIIEEQDITELIVVEFPMYQNLFSYYSQICEKRGVSLLVICDFDRALRQPVTMFEDGHVRFLGLREEPLEDPAGRFMKRLLDICVSVPVVVFILPFTTILVAILQRRSSRGPIFFRQLRSGFQNIPFAIYKYRTMHVANPDPAKQATKGDARIYPAGRWLRKLSIDELPQFVNVLSGEMSVVGPRPHLLKHGEQFAEVLANYHVRRNVKPGITGLAQIRGFRGETKATADIANRVESDIYYIENWSFLMDCWIILMTAVQMIFPPQSAH